MYYICRTGKRAHSPGVLWKYLLPSLEAYCFVSFILPFAKLFFCSFLSVVLCFGDALTKCKKEEKRRKKKRRRFVTAPLWATCRATLRLWQRVSSRNTKASKWRRGHPTSFNKQREGTKKSRDMSGLCYLLASLSLKKETGKPGKKDAME